MQNDPAKEAKHFDNILAMGCTAILFNSADADGSVLNVKRAMAAGIHTFYMDRISIHKMQPRLNCSPTTLPDV